MAIVVFEPRYHDKHLLVAKYKVARGRMNRINITKGAYKGKYRMSGLAIASYPVESNGTIDCFSVPLDKLEKI